MIDPNQLLQDLTQPQQQAVCHVDGPLLIIAGAGSGKTRVLTRRVAWLIGQGIPASSILAITFTNKAAGEMKSRIESLLGGSVRDFGQLVQQSPMICTFHSFCLRVLRHYADCVGLPPNFSIYDSSDQSKLIRDAIKTLELSTTNFPPASIHGTISNAKNKLQRPDDYTQASGDFYTRTVARVYKKYQELLASNNALDFDDLLMRTVFGFRDHPDMLAQLQDRFQYVLIDEYQDTNHAQYILAHALAMRHKNICVVGDPDQSIYAWRGADIHNILNFEKDYRDAQVIRLEQNYRSTKTILSIASKLIAHNTQRKKKDLWTHNPQGEKARLLLCSDEHEESASVAAELKKLAEEGGYAWSQMAVFYRINALSRVMEDTLRKQNIPYRMARGVEFYNRKEIKDVLAYLRVIANPSDQVSLERIANTPTRGISDATLKQLETRAYSSAQSLWQALCDAPNAGLNTRAAKACAAFVEQVIGWRAAAEDHSENRLGVKALMERVVRESGLEDYYKKLGGDELAELSNVNELITSATEFDAANPEGTLVDYLAQISLVSDTDQLKDAGGAVTMMTLHSAKGLEFPVVAIIGLEEGCLPHARARDDEAQMEEERRLCFVGITRAQERLILSKAGSRMIRGIRERTIQSPFLNQMSQGDLEVIDGAQDGFGGFADPTDDPILQFRKNQRVRHRIFGIGRIMEVSRMGAQTRAVVEFNTVGRKNLILEYAKLEAMD